LILGAFEGDDVRFRVPIAFARSATAGLVTWSSELRRRGEPLSAAIDALYASAHAPAARSRQGKPRKPSIARQIAQAEKTGKTVTSVTTPDGTTIHFGESTNPDSDALDQWIAKHADSPERH
jgi:hypothetical protein